MEIKSLLSRMSELLEAGGYPEWSESIVSVIGLMDNDPLRANSIILGMFGGAGSINDLVLYKDGSPLVEENQELDDLRAAIFSLVH